MFTYHERIEYFISALNEPDQIERARVLSSRNNLDMNLFMFAKQSCEIEGVFDYSQQQDQYDSIERLLYRDTLSITDLVLFNSEFGRLRVNGECVTVGNYTPPKGGQGILYSLDTIVDKVNRGVSAYKMHKEFESLHPFTDGNGRTGRAIWLWQMVNQQGYDINNLFLQQWYYQSLGEQNASI